MTKSMWEFSENLHRAATSTADESIVRCMLHEVARDCPVDLLVQLGQCILQYAKEKERT